LHWALEHFEHCVEACISRSAFRTLVVIDFFPLGMKSYVIRLFFQISYRIDLRPAATLPYYVLLDIQVHQAKIEVHISGDRWYTYMYRGFFTTISMLPQP
jgi:hypothetical protein